MIKKLTAAYLILAVFFSFNAFPAQVHAATDIVNDATLSTNLLSCWDLNESSGARLDEAGSNDLGALNTPTQETGLIDEAVGMQRSQSDGIYIATASQSPDLSIGSSDFSITGWVYFDTLTSGEFYYFVNKYDSGNGKREYYIRYSVDDGLFQFGIWNSTTATDFVTASTFGAASTGTWYFFYAGLDQSGNLEISINDGTVDTTARTVTTHDGTGSFNLGFNDDPSGSTFHHLNGRMDVVAVWNKLLTSSEITNLYASGNGIPCVSAGGGGAAPQPPEIISF